MDFGHQYIERMMQVKESLIFSFQRGIQTRHHSDHGRSISQLKNGITGWVAESEDTNGFQQQYQESKHMN